MTKIKNTQVLEQYLVAKKDVVNQTLEQLLPSAKEYPELIHEAMRYSIFAGGKRFRSLLTLAICDACGGDERLALHTAVSLEMIHTYSLIHDDLPSMDDDYYRRGQLANHKKFGEAVAILSGDALLTLAFEVMDPRVVGLIAKAIGSQGVVGGQVMDILLAKGQMELTEPLLEYIHKHKTGKLIQVACLAGAYLAEASPEVIAAIAVYGEKIGFSFQVVDDLFDHDNYAVILSEEKARDLADTCIREAKEALTVLDAKKREILEQLADFVAMRKE